MDQLRKNKEFIIRYYNAVSGVAKTRELLEQYTTDEGLMQHITFFEKILPRYQIFVDELTAEGNRVVVRARVKGRSEGEFMGIPPTHREIEVYFVVSYEIENNKIVRHWLIADQMSLMEQLGVMNVVQG